MRYFLSVGIVLLFHTAFSQVGIGTTDPQQDLHISGSGNPIIRIDGLNSTNNLVHQNNASTKRIFVTSDGDLILAKNKIFGSTPIAFTNINAGSETFITALKFTLTETSIVHLESYLSVSVTVQNNETIQDGQARRVGVYYRFISAPSTVSTTTNFGNHVNSYSTGSSSSTTIDYKTGNFYFVPRKEILLPPGEYSVGLYSVLGNNMSGSVNSSSQATQKITVRSTPIAFTY